MAMTNYDNLAGFDVPRRRSGAELEKERIILNITSMDGAELVATLKNVAHNLPHEAEKAYRYVSAFYHPKYNSKISLTLSEAVGLAAHVELLRSVAIALANPMPLVKT